MTSLLRRLRPDGGSESSCRVRWTRVLVGTRGLAVGLGDAISDGQFGRASEVVRLGAVLLCRICSLAVERERERERGGVSASCFFVH